LLAFDSGKLVSQLPVAISFCPRFKERPAPQSSIN
jgi:hypothetical protein